MDWLEDTTARWSRIMAAAGHGSTPLDEGVRLISEVGGTAAQERPSGFRQRKQTARETVQESVVTNLSRHLVIGVLMSDHLLTRLAAATGQTRERLLDELTTDLAPQVNDERLRALRFELSAGIAMQGTENPTYTGLAERIEQLLKLAESQATELVEKARAEAAEIRRCRECGSD
jgi:hypothetical protein